MNPGAVEEGAKVATGFITTMSSQPVMLGMVIIVLSQIAMLWYTLNFTGQARKNEFELIFKQQKEFTELLSRCVVPQSFKLQSDESNPVELPPLPQARPPDAPN
jgi:hypothetical protein